MAAFAGSYIKTVASQVTRSADAASMTGANFSSWFRADEGTLYAEYLIPSLLDGTVVSIDDNTQNNRWQIRYMLSPERGRHRFVSASGSFDLTDTTVKPIANTFNKTAYVAKSGNQSFVINSVVSSQVGTQSIMPVVNQLTIGNGPASDQAQQITIRKLAFYPKRLANDQLQGITTV
jgi:hypothetical protein